MEQDLNLIKNFNALSAQSLELLRQQLHLRMSSAELLYCAHHYQNRGNGDISEDEAIERASAALAPYYPEDRVTTYLICPGYLMGGEGINGIWEIYFKGNDMIYQVNLDAVTGEIYYNSAEDNGNG